MKTFCVLPFYSYEVEHPGNTKNIYCCRIAPNTDISEIRASISQDQRNPACNSCWKLEDRGQTSERQIHNRTFDYLLDRDIEDIKKSALRGDYSSKIIKLATSNICNSTCVTCNSEFSSAWAKLENSVIDYQSIPNDFLKNINWDEIVQLSFVGGEPLLEKLNLKILERLSKNNQDCFVSIVTNGSIKLSEYHYSILKKLKNLNICVSIDGVGTRFEYMRYPLKWNDLLSNLRIFSEITENISVSSMVSNLNVFYFDEMIDFFEEYSLKYLCKQIELPEYFSPGNLPVSIKKELLSRSRRPTQISAFLESSQGSSELLAQCWKEIQRQDQLKKINIRDYLPEFLATKI